MLKTKTKASLKLLPKNTYQMLRIGRGAQRGAKLGAG
jgi:hypothetical protein